MAPPISVWSKYAFQDFLGMAWDHLNFGAPPAHQQSPSTSLNNNHIFGIVLHEPWLFTIGVLRVNLKSTVFVSLTIHQLWDDSAYPSTSFWHWVNPPRTLGASPRGCRKRAGIPALQRRESKLQRQANRLVLKWDACIGITPHVCFNWACTMEKQRFAEFIIWLIHVCIHNRYVLSLYIYMLISYYICMYTMIYI